MDDKKPIEKTSKIMNLPIQELYDNADTVVCDRRNDSLNIKYCKLGYSIQVQIKKTDIDEKLVEQEGLSERDREVLRKIALGQKQKDISKELGISQSRISSIKKSYNDKKSNKEMVRLVDKDEKKK